MRRPLLLTLLLLWTACAGGGPADPEPAALPTALDFPPTYVGFERWLELPPAAAGMGATLEAPGAFALQQVDGAWRLRFRPEAPGDVQGTLWLESAGQVRKLQLHGSGQETPDCGPGTRCRAPRFDPEQAACAEVLAADGTPCGCGAGATCVRGVCAHEAASCAQEESCPEGAACARPSMCGSEGVCRAGACVPAGEGRLEVAWTHTPRHPHLLFRGVTDAQGNPVWHECLELPQDRYQCDLVSVDAAGRERFRVTGPLRGRYSSGIGASVLVANGTIVSAVGSNTLEAHASADGAARWLYDLRTAFPARSDCAESVFASRLLHAGADQLLVEAYTQCASPRAWRLTVSLTSGKLLALEPVQGSHPTAIAIDSQDRRFALTYSWNQVEGAAFGSLRAESGEGTPLWTQGPVPSPGWEVVAAGDAVLHGSAQALSALTGTPIPLAPPLDFSGVPALAEDGRGYFVGDLCPEWPCAQGSPRPPVRYLLAFDLPTARPLWKQPVPAGQDFALTARRSVLHTVADLPSGKVSRVRELSLDGEPLAECTLPQGHGAPWAQPAFGPERLVFMTYGSPEEPTRVVAYALPGLSPAATGWTMSGGNPSRTRRAR